ncbi:hypothetical protein QTO34_000017 [Cnephaeus nilssonii]|uniref:Uncharacterized protein n=1 Tax=Cnephaeus nilssonii TaxID=3371016 RepID=A0AA40IAM9_CNENI|nr:hypothetical protein QTO34_000017 [Eptesicus nilssonii]
MKDRLLWRSDRRRSDGSVPKARSPRKRRPLRSRSMEAAWHGNSGGTRRRPARSQCTKQPRSPRPQEQAAGQGRVQASGAQAPALLRTSAGVVFH